MWSEVEDALIQSATSVMTGIARLLPGTIAFVVSLLLSILIGWMLAWIVRRALSSIAFDSRIFGSPFPLAERWTGGRSPSALVAQGVWWIVVLVGVLGGIAAFDPTLTSNLALRIFGSAMNLLTALVLLVVGTLLARFCARGVLISLVNMNVPQARLVSLGVKWLVMILTIAMALDHLSIGGRIVELAFGILFGGVVLTLALAVGLHSRDLAAWSVSRRPDERTTDDVHPIDHL